MLESILGPLSLIFHAAIAAESMFYMVFFFFLDVQLEIILLDFVSFNLSTNIISNGYCQNIYSENVFHFF